MPLNYRAAAAGRDAGEFSCGGLAPCLSASVHFELQRFYNDHRAIEALQLTDSETLKAHLLRRPATPDWKGRSTRGRIGKKALIRRKRQPVRPASFRRVPGQVSRISEVRPR